MCLSPALCVACCMRYVCILCMLDKPGCFSPAVCVCVRGVCVCVRACACPCTRASFPSTLFFTFGNLTMDLDPIGVHNAIHDHSLGEFFPRWRLGHIASCGNGALGDCSGRRRGCIEERICTRERERERAIEWQNALIFETYRAFTVPQFSKPFSLL